MQTGTGNVSVIKLGQVLEQDLWQEGGECHPYRGWRQSVEGPASIWIFMDNCYVFFSSFIYKFVQPF